MKDESTREEPASACAPIVSDDLLDQFIGEYIAAQDNPTVFFTWQGGEPTLAGLDFYRRVIELQKKHARPDITIANSIQTNGVLLDEQWCQFLAEHQWPVGIIRQFRPPAADRCNRPAFHVDHTGKCPESAGFRGGSR